MAANITSIISIADVDDDTQLGIINGDTWGYKKEQGISLNQPVSGVEIPESLEAFTAILTRMHSLE